MLGAATPGSINAALAALGRREGAGKSALPTHARRRSASLPCPVRITPLGSPMRTPTPALPISHLTCARRVCRVRSVVGAGAAARSGALASGASSLRLSPALRASPNLDRTETGLPELAADMFPRQRVPHTASALLPPPPRPASSDLPWPAAEPSLSVPAFSSQAISPCPLPPNPTRWRCLSFCPPPLPSPSRRRSCRCRGHTSAVAGQGAGGAG